MLKKINIGLVFGGRSGEHEVSLKSAKSIYENLDKEKYEVFLIGVRKDGQWILAEKQFPDYLSSEELNKKAMFINLLPKEDGTEIVFTVSGERAGRIDVFFPIIHGTYGEDGCLQGFFEILNAAYVGSGVLASAVGMDKVVMKRLLREAGLPIGKFLSIDSRDFSELFLDLAIEKLELPIFVKPANMGSSVGVSMAKNKKELELGLKAAFRYDNKAILEENILGREIECSILGDEKPIASLPGEIRANHEFYSYEAKYLDKNGAEILIPARLSDNAVQKVQALAIKTFQALEGSGLARVDFFLKPDGNFVINEINTLPGFTEISMYPKLWLASGISYPDLLDRLIVLALKKHEQKSRLLRAYEYEGKN